MTQNSTPQLRLNKFKEIVINLYNEDNLACNYLQKTVIFKAVKLRYFSKKYPLKDEENIFLYPSATTQFQNAIEKGHNLKSCEKDLNFLNKEFNKYFEALKHKQILFVRNSGHFEDYYINPEILFPETKKSTVQSKKYHFENCNVAFNSKDVIQNLNITDSDVKKKIDELEKAIKEKNPSKIKWVFGYIADKAIDIAIAILVNGMTK